MRVKIKVKKGKLTGGRDQLAALIHSLDGEYMLEFTPLRDPESAEDWRKLYFYLRDIIHSSAETGYTKDELHQALKLAVFPALKPEHFTDDNGELSTKYLTEEGWKQFVRGVKEVAMDMFELVL